MINLSINGTNLSLNEHVTIDELLEKQGISKMGIAVAVNESIVPRANHSVYKVTDGDKIEIIRAIGGG